MGVIEALSYGVPCLVTKGTNMADDIKEFDAGWTCDTSKEELIEAIKQMLSQKEELSKLGGREEGNGGKGKAPKGLKLFTSQQKSQNDTYRTRSD